MPALWSMDLAAMLSSLLVLSFMLASIRSTSVLPSTALLNWLTPISGCHSPAMWLAPLGRCHTMEANLPLLEVISHLLAISWSMDLEETSSHIPIRLLCTQSLLKSPLQPRQPLLYNKLLFFPEIISCTSVILPITAMSTCLLTLPPTLSTTVRIASVG